MDHQIQEDKFLGHRMAHVSQDPFEQREGQAEAQAGDLGIEARPFIAHKGMLCRVEADVEFGSGLLKRSLNLHPSFFRDVRIECAEDEQHFAANLGGAFKRAGVRIFAEFAVMNACGIKADRRAHLPVKRRAKRQMPADAESAGG